jgi:putative tricarboxylic transport membrane protein
MSVFEQLVAGFQVALTPENFGYCLLGSAIGTMVGVLPGISPVTTIAMLLPITFKIPAVSALIMLAGIYYGAHHAGSTTAIMLNMPGEPSSVVVCMDGHPMARQGRAGVALCISALGSFFAGCVGIIVITFFSPILSEAGLLFGAPEYTALVAVALMTASVMAAGSALSTFGMAILGLLIGTVGTDVGTGLERFTFDSPNLADGIDFVAVAVGLFAFSEVAQHVAAPDRHKTFSVRFAELFPRLKDLKQAFPAILRGTSLGAALGILPGTGPLVSAFAAYALERQVAKDKTRFGKGAIEGVAAPEAADNAAAMTHFIPMLGLGIPAGAAMAMMLGALTIQGVQPGPQLMSTHPELFWGVVASMWIGNMMLLILNLPMIGVWIKFLSIPYRFLYPGIILFCCIGVYSVRNSAFDVLLAAGIGLFGITARQLNCSPAPLVLGLILGPIFEENFRRSLTISNGDPTIFLRHPIAAGLLVLFVVFAFAVTMSGVRTRKQEIEQEAEAV